MKKWLWWVALTIIACMLSLLQWRYPLPTGTVSVELSIVVIASEALGLNVSFSYFSLIFVACTLVFTNFSNWPITLPILLDLVVISFILRWHTNLDVKMTHSQAISFGMITGISQFFGILLVVCVQAYNLVNHWSDLQLVLRMAVPPALLAGLLDCLLVPLLTLLVRHFNEKTADKQS